MVKIFYYLKRYSENIFGKIICSTYEKKSFVTILGNFLKIELLTENQQAQTLQKWGQFCTIS